MAIIGLTLSKTTAYQSARDPDKGKEGATTFMLGTLDSRVVGKLRDNATSFGVNPGSPDEDVDVNVGQNQLYYEACKYGIKGWTNYKDEEGSDIRFRTYKKNFGGKTYEVVDDGALARLPQDILSELGREILDLNEVTPEEKKG